MEKANSELTLTEAKSINLEYWTAMRKYFEERGTFLKHQKPQAAHWTNFALGKSYFHMAAVSQSYKTALNAFKTFRKKLQFSAVYSDLNC